MKQLLICCILLFFTRASAQNGISLSIDPEVCYKKGYLSATLVFTNSTSVSAFFKSETIVATESMFGDSANLEVYKKGALLFYLYDRNEKRIEWFGQPPIIYKYKFSKTEDFVVPASGEVRIPVAICLKKYEKWLNRGKKYSLRLVLVQNEKKLLPIPNSELFLGSLSTNNVFFTP
ncbi:hypothetical protein LZD49_04630 [Dyadobacter sp. CY261]|uniref:hypothetical protein n=1 Tax=Dyadobacter sp. CY261 TaxID=2907203 RepID=UPI001F4353E8|nr:hypothetical protein [Dyadobacter sp. CY261]MCF0069746.1 hypothetical protein [Dyadobacter sp. CY261]